MSDQRHVMEIASKYAGEYLFVCPVEDCGRKMVIKTASGGDVVVLERGDPAALHRGSLGGTTMSARKLGPQPHDPTQN